MNHPRNLLWWDIAALLHEGADGEPHRVAQTRGGRQNKNYFLISKCVFCSQINMFQTIWNLSACMYVNKTQGGGASSFQTWPHREYFFAFPELVDQYLRLLGTRVRVVPLVRAKPDQSINQLNNQSIYLSINQSMNQSIS